MNDSRPPVSYLTILFVFVTTAVLLVGPPFLLDASGDELQNEGVVPFLLSPVPLVIFVPFLAARHQPASYRGFLTFFLYPFFIAFLFFLCYLQFSSPLPGAIWRSAFLLTAFTLLLGGFTILIRHLTGRSMISQGLGTIAGLALLGSVFYLSPVVDLYSSQAGIRRFWIDISVYPNPIMGLGGGIRHQDLLRGSLLYEYIPTGRYYQYNSPDYQMQSLVYAVVGLFMMGVAWFRSNTSTGDSKEEIDR